MATWPCGLICGTPSQNRSQPIENCERGETPSHPPRRNGCFRLFTAVSYCVFTAVSGCLRLFAAVCGCLRLFRTARFRLARAPVSGFLTNPTCGGHQAAVCEEALQMHDQRVSLKFMRVGVGVGGWCLESAFTFACMKQRQTFGHVPPIYWSPFVVR